MHHRNGAFAKIARNFFWRQRWGKRPKRGGGCLLRGTEMRGRWGPTPTPVPERGGGRWVRTPPSEHFYHKGVGGSRGGGSPNPPAAQPDQNGARVGNEARGQNGVEWGRIRKRVWGKKGIGGPAMVDRMKITHISSRDSSLFFLG